MFSHALNLELPKNWGRFAAVFPEEDPGPINYVFTEPTSQAMRPSQREAHLVALERVAASLGDPGQGMSHLGNHEELLERLGTLLDEMVAPSGWHYYLHVILPGGEVLWLTNSKRKQLLEILPLILAKMEGK